MLYTFSSLFFLINVVVSIEEKDESQIAGAPSELRVYSGSDSVQLSWLPPIDDNVMIRGYQIGWGINIPDIEKITVSKEARDYTIQDLKPNREYVISLRAFNNLGQGFPIYETVKTNSYGKIVTELPKFRESLLTPVGLYADTLSSSQIKLSWIDANENAFNQLFTIRYGIRGDNNNGPMKMLNITDTEYIFDGLRPNTEYEFAVKLANAHQWSLTAINRTFAVPPSSAPRDLTVTGQQTTSDDPTTVLLTWQPPKFANGEIREYIVLYSNNINAPEHDWNMESVKGDHLSMLIRGLRSGQNYYFKIQSRNVKGYGPFSLLVSFATPVIEQDLNVFDQQLITTEKTNITLYQQAVNILSANITNFLFGIVTIIIIILAIVFILMRVSKSTNQRKNSRIKNITRQKQTNPYPPAFDDDLWIQQNGGRFAALVNTNGMDFDITTTANQAQEFLLLNRENTALITPGLTSQYINSPVTQSRMYPDAMPYQVKQTDLSRDYNCSTLITSTGQGQLRCRNDTYSNHRTPTTVHNKQAVAKVNFPCEHQPFDDNSCFLSEIRGIEVDNLQQSPLPVTETVANSNNGYQIVHNCVSTMHSFAPSNQCAPVSKSRNNEVQQKVAHVVRPIISATVANSSPSLVRNATSQKTPEIGQRIIHSTTNKVPVGRATAQPRVNIVNSKDMSTSPSPYSSVRVQREPAKIIVDNDKIKNDLITSADDLNVHEIDQMIDTLQQLQHEFTTTITDD